MRKCLQRCECYNPKPAHHAYKARCRLKLVKCVPTVMFLKEGCLDVQATHSTAVGTNKHHVSHALMLVHGQPAWQCMSEKK